MSNENEIKEKIIEVENKTNSETDPQTEALTDSDWSEEYKGDRPASDSSWFSDIVPQGALSFKTEYVFKTEGEKAINNFNKKVIRFAIDHEGKEKTMEVGCNQYDFLKVLAENKPLIGKVFEHERTGVGQKDTRRSVKLKQE